MRFETSRFTTLAGRAGLLLGFLALALPTLARPADDPKDPVYERRYLVRKLALYEAEVLAWDQCGQQPRELCRVRESGMMEGGVKWVTLIADDAAHQAYVRTLASRDGVPTTQAFQIVLLIADRQGKESLDALPANTRKAIEDVAGFLPFTRYRLVDAGWVRTSGEARVTLNGPDGFPLEVTLSFLERTSDQLFIEPFAIEAAGVSYAAEQSPTGKSVQRGPRRLLATSFGMKVGETLVVGTSKLDGSEQALVAVVSATK